MFETADPKQRFFVLNKIDLSFKEQARLFKLYQPIVGAISISLYQTLIHLFDENAILSDAQGIYFLQEQLDCSLKEIFTSLHKLEGVGLVKTYLMDNDFGKIIAFQLKRVSSAQAFFAEPLLASLLKEKVGVTYFRKLSYKFAKENQLKQKPIRQAKDISANFFDVFRLPEQEAIDPAEDVKKAAKLNQIEETQVAAINDQDSIDWQYLKDRFDQYHIPNSQIDLNKQKIRGLIETYGLSEEEFISESLPSLHGKNTLDLGQISQLLANNYKKTTTRNRLQKELKSGEKANTGSQLAGLSDKEILLLNRALSLSPGEFLYQAKAEKGGFASPNENRTINILKTQYGLPSELINVLIYVCLTYDSVVAPNLAYRIANDWLQHGIKKALDAIKYFKQRKTANKRTYYHQPNQKRVEQGTDWSKKKAKTDTEVNSEDLKRFFENLEKNDGTN